MPGIRQEFAGQLLAQLTRDAIVGPITGYARSLAEQLGQGITQSPELDVLYILVQLDPNDREAIWKEYQQALANGYDDIYASNLASLLKRKDGEIDTPQAKEFLAQYARLEPGRRAEMIEFVRRNSLLQKVNAHLASGLSMLESISHAAAESLGGGSRVINDWARKKKEKLEPTRVRLQEQADMPEFWWRWLYAVRYMRKDGWREALRLQKEQDAELVKTRSRAIEVSNKK